MAGWEKLGILTAAGNQSKRDDSPRTEARRDMSRRWGRRNHSTLALATMWHRVELQNIDLGGWQWQQDEFRVLWRQDIAAGRHSVKFDLLYTVVYPFGDASRWFLHARNIPMTSMICPKFVDIVFLVKASKGVVSASSRR
ncbi:uncharacterized protein CLUP02_07906 [Colletotrichum lupini]|uniref:Uncharacterized protein n=1 Tax=Colletotrichum lupini TaxID=145971 RepID=A0A9Q8WG44_9PEZI|nr:uncharacterized protein CLUP02_07906 [Colletotrichum lupini]UQC82418.1 hypothetical protein CLUP02_07906 [Colletotrichum lupini]